jgi:regulator of sigma E protease
MESLAQLGNWSLVALAVLAILTVLVAVHELGHHLTARLFGMHVDAFAVMMGGVRATDLSPYLKKPLWPARWVALLWVLFLLAAFVGGVEGWTALYVSGLALGGLLMPLWVATRVGALYGLGLAESLKAPLLGILGLGGLTLVAGRLGASASEVLVVSGIGAVIGLAVLYYRPVAHRAEDAPMGEGGLEINDKHVPVRFRPLVSRRDRHGTEYSLLLIPAGGFAAIKGMHPKPDGSEVLIPQGFYSKPPWQRFLVLFAGPLFSIAFGVLVLIGIFTTFGVERAVNEPVVGVVAPGSAAAKAGIQKGDRVVAIEGRPVSTFFDVIRVVRESPDRPLAFQIDRDGNRIESVITPVRDPAPTPVLSDRLELTSERRVQGKWGAQWTTEKKVLPLGEATIEALAFPVKVAGGLAALVSNPTRAKDEVGGPGTIAAATSVAVETGFDRVLFIAAALSISLGFMNLLPIPPLDGGQMVVAFVEMLRGGRRLSIQVQHAVSTAGFFLVFALIVGALAVDITRFTGR